MTPTGLGLARVIAAIVLIVVGVILGLLGQGIGWVLAVGGAVMAMLYLSRLGQPANGRRRESDSESAADSDAGADAGAGAGSDRDDLPKE